MVRPPDGRTVAGVSALEESPGSTVKRRWVTPTGGNPRDSATESIPPCTSVRGKGERVG